MKLKCITCSGANEHTDIKRMKALYADFPKVEFGIQVSGKKCGNNSPRWEWLQDLREQVYSEPMPLALHLNQDWVERFCRDEIVFKLEELLGYRNFDNNPMFRRVQLNFKIGREETPDLLSVAGVIKSYPQIRFILSYNQSNAEFINQLYYRMGVRFDCLYDNSFGEGILSEERLAPAFRDVLQGYAGGLSPENVYDELEKIAENLPQDAEFFIDAEGALKGLFRHLSIDKCRKFVKNALAWEQDHS